MLEELTWRMNLQRKTLDMRFIGLEPFFIVLKGTKILFTGFYPLKYYLKKMGNANQYACQF